MSYTLFFANYNFYSITYLSLNLIALTSTCLYFCTLVFKSYSLDVYYNAITPEPISSSSSYHAAN